jgi:nucleotide-binding universal stress UspA family protein
MKNFLLPNLLADAINPTTIEAWRGTAPLPNFHSYESAVAKARIADSCLSKILVPLSLAEDSGASLDVAQELARESGAQIVLLHVVQLNIAGEERGIHRARLLDELSREAERQLSQLARSMGKHVKTETVACAGRPAGAILETSKRLGADAIVLGLRNYPRWLKWFHRQTASSVLRQADCLVCLVSPNHRQAAAIWRESFANTRQVILRAA